MLGEIMRAWIGCLACYNGGDLVGHWYDATEAGEVTSEQLHRDSGNSPIPPEIAGATHEELWVMDTDGGLGLFIGGDGECSPATVAEIAEILADADLPDHEVEGLSYYRSHVGDPLTAEMISDFQDHYHGAWESERAYAEDLAEEAETELRMALARSSYPYASHEQLRDKAKNIDIPWPYNYVDWDHATSELFMDGYWSSDRGEHGVHIFTY